MTLFQSVIGVIFSLGFLTLLFMFIGYFALPFFLILLAVGLFNFFRGNKIFMRTQTPFHRQASHHTVYRKQDDNVIDVDYTELP